MTKVLIVGARPGSLGRAVAAECRRGGYTPVTAGVGAEEVHLDVVGMTDAGMRSMLAQIQPDHIVCTAGHNVPEARYSMTPARYYEDHFAVNCIGPMRLLNAWQDILNPEMAVHHYVGISSNSARVPRSGSSAYCASKAAFSMALRVKARETAAAATDSGGGLVVYGYEPGLLRGTPMTDQTARDYPGVPLTRMRPPVLSGGIEATMLADLVVAGLSYGWAMNGCLVPFDADEA